MTDSDEQKNIYHTFLSLRIPLEAHKSVACFLYTHMKKDTKTLFQSICCIKNPNASMLSSLGHI